jgi:hypothetical protein
MPPLQPTLLEKENMVITETLEEIEERLVMLLLVVVSFSLWVGRGPTVGSYACHNQSRHRRSFQCTASFELFVHLGWPRRQRELLLSLDGSSWWLLDLWECNRMWLSLDCVPLRWKWMFERIEMKWMNWRNWSEKREAWKLKLREFFWKTIEKKNETLLKTFSSSSFVHFWL